MITTIFRNRNNFDVAHIDVFSGSAFIWAEVTAWILRLLSKPYILTLHGGNLPNFAAKYSRRVRTLLISANAVTTPSDYLLVQMQMYRDDIRLIPNPINLQNYTFRLRNKPQTRLLYLRALHKIYNPSLAIHTLEELIYEYPNIHLTIVGPDKGDGTAAKVDSLIVDTGYRIKSDWLDLFPNKRFQNG